ncbi:hypothetical protein [Carboxylicivirga marina]|uniref:hypothetical protein n=1 Tax=Carboxylicivirga marina TaxID=2800988 RepID=UPI002592D97D|nr:hypothetical protein [uncultured Carboxylicivirga sp.]
MKAIDIKEKWLGLNSYNEWTEYKPEQLAEIKLRKKTIDFLAVGFMTSAAPFLDFREYSDREKFQNLVQFYKKYNQDLNTKLKRFVPFGSDSGGNMFCFDSNENDRIVLLDHEYEFDKQSFVNIDLNEFADCILVYNTFVESIQTKYGEDAFLDGTYKEEDVQELIKNFNIINSDLLKHNEFWNIELNGLLEEIK